MMLHRVFNDDLAVALVARSHSYDVLLDMQETLRNVFHIIIDIRPEKDGTFAFAYFASLTERCVIGNWVQKQSQTAYRVWLEDHV